jgi:phosphatidylserine decarboxylase
MVATGLYYALLSFLVGGLLGRFLASWAAAPLVLFGLFCLWFFRDPERAIPRGPVAVSPADGKVVLLRHRPEGTEVCIFMNLLDVHVNRTPIGGKVVAVTYSPGKFTIASRDQASCANERNTISVEAKDGVTVRFSQIAGLLARRIVCRVKPGDYVTTGERIGMIQFGSRVDVELGTEWTIEVHEGQRVRGGATVLARRLAAEG